MKIAITATGTEIGKTYLGCLLLRHARSKSLSCQAIKPVMSGFDEQNLAKSDAGQLAQACGLEADAQTISDICAHRFTPELAPNVAARQAGIDLDYNDIQGFVAQRLAEKKDFSLVEGAGGLLSPITDTKLNADLFADLHLPALLVTSSYLGSISHSLASLESAHNKHIPIAAVVITKPNDSYGPTDEFKAELERWTDTPIFCLETNLEREAEAIFNQIQSFTST